MVGADGVSRSIDDLDPIFAEKYLLLKSAFVSETGERLIETCTWRSPAAQLAAYNAGKSLLKVGKHNTVNAAGVPAATAVDVAVLVGDPSVITWDASHYAPLGVLAPQFGLVWGGAWMHLKDADHLELAPPPPDPPQTPR